MTLIKRWLPFLFLLTAITCSLLYLLFKKNPSEYFPHTDDPAVIYQEACMQCHGDQGQGSGLFYPAFKPGMDENKIFDAVTKGALLMPVFTHIKGDTLSALIHYIQSGAYK